METVPDQHEDELQVQIIFTAENIDGDISPTIVKHLLVIAKNNAEYNISFRLKENGKIDT